MKLTTDIQEAIAVLRSGGVIVYPTETSYGIGCDATNERAVLRVFEIKHRAPGKGVTLLLSMNERFGDSFATWNQHLLDLAMKFWPGPLNVICPIKPESSIASLCATEQTIAVRRSSHPIANALVDELGAPLVSTSANISGEPELYSAQEIFDRFSREALQPDCIFDAGLLPKRAPSTLVAFDDARGVVVLRQGEIVV
jgi:L-threonylcarbamoyladenylate synthase